MSAWADQRKKGGEQMKGTNFKRTGSEDGGVKKGGEDNSETHRSSFRNENSGGKKLHIV